MFVGKFSKFLGKSKTKKTTTPECFFFFFCFHILVSFFFLVAAPLNRDDLVDLSKQGREAMLTT